MSRARDKAAVALGSAVLLTGALTYLQPPSPDPAERRRDQVERQLGDLQDADEQVKERHRDAGRAQLDAELARRARPGVHRPPPPPPRAGPRIRLPLP